MRRARFGWVGVVVASMALVGLPSAHAAQPATATLVVTGNVPGHLTATDPAAEARIDVYAVVAGKRAAEPRASASSAITVDHPYVGESFDLDAGTYAVRITGRLGLQAAVAWEATASVAAGKTVSLQHLISFGAPIKVSVLSPTGTYVRGRSVIGMEVPCSGALPAPRRPNGSATSSETGASGTAVVATLPGRCYDLGGSVNIYDPYVPVVRRVAAGTSGIVFHDDYATTAAIEASKLAYGKRSIVVDVRAVHQAHGSTPVIRGGKVAVYEHEHRVTTWETVKDGKARLRFLHSPKPGKHTYYIGYEGTSGIQGAWKYDHVLVGHAPAKVTVKTASLRRWYRGTVTVAVSAGVRPKGKVVAYVGGRKVGSATVHKVDGKYVAKVPVGVVTTRGGSLKVTVKYSGNASVSKASTTRKVTVRR